MKPHFSVGLALAALAAGCAAAQRTAEDTVREVRSELGNQPKATARLVNAQGQEVGTATLEQEEDGVDLTLHVTGMTPGEHGVHIHAVGRCTPPDFSSAGTHFNPSGKQHGLENPQGPDNGDMRNARAGADGVLHAELENDRISLGDGPNSIFDADGTAIVVHAGPDDYRNPLTGPNGVRVACGVFTRG